MIKGTYVFYENDKEIARSSNIITKFGKRYFSKLMAGNVPSATKDLAVGMIQKQYQELLLQDLL